MGRKKRKHEPEVRDDFESPRRSRRTQHRFQRLMRRFGLLLLLLVGLVAAAPTILSKTSLSDSLISGQFPSGWSIASEQVSLGWASNQTFTGVTLTDTEGKPLLTVESLTLSKSLVALVMNQTDLGRIEIVRPVAYVETRPDGSNWEDFLNALLAQQQGESTGDVQLGIEIVDGVVHGVDRVTGQQWSLQTANVSAELGEAMQVSGSAQLATQQPAQQGQMKFRWQPNEEGGQQLELLAERLPLGSFSPWLARVVPGAKLAGRLSADATIAWSADEDSPRTVFQTTGRAEISDLDFSAASLQGDRLRSSRCNARWDLGTNDDFFSMTDSQVDTDWGSVSGDCLLKRDEQGNFRLYDSSKNDTKIEGSFDLAKLAVMLPRTLRLRPGVEIDEGRIEVSLAGLVKNDRPSWQIAASVQGLVGSEGERLIRWNEPVVIWVDFLEVPKAGVRLEHLLLKAGFANVEIQAGQEEIHGEFKIDLEEFVKELGQFVEMEAWQLQGLGEGTFSLTRQTNQQFSAEANIDLTALHLAGAEKIVWTEPKLRVELRATGTEQDFSPRAIATGKIELRGPRDHFKAELLEPVDLDAARQSWLMQVEGQGPLALWAGRLRPWINAIPERLEGDAHLRVRLQVAEDAVHVVESTGSVVQLRMQNGPMTLDEPRVEFAGDGRWDRLTGSIWSQELQLLGSSFSFRGRDVAIALAAQDAPTARGNIAFRADLERLAAMAGLVGQTTSTWPRGTAVGQLRLTSSADQVLADFGMQVEQLELARMTAANGAVYGRPEIVWTEPQLEVTGVAKYAVAEDRVQLDNLQVRGKTLQLNTSASIDKVSTEGLLKASGLLEYDPDELAKLVASYAGQGIQLQGDRQVRFQVTGPVFADASTAATHWSHRWDINAEAGWSSAGVYGLSLSGGRLNGTLRDGQLQFAPLDVAVGRGRLTVQPRASLIPGAEQIFLTRGPLVSNVAISPEVSETMLKYIAPILAGATRAEGQFSIELDQAEVPLGTPKQSRVQGRLTAHRLAVSPGPMMNQLVTLVDQIEALTKRKQFLQAATSPSNKSFLTMADQQVDFQVVEGRVYHRNLKFLIDDVPVRSRGSVGFDQTLALEIEVPIQEKWIEREPALRGFAGQSLRIPIYGTFQKPRIDERALADFSKQLLQGAAKQAIGDELNRQFEKLFGR